MRAEAPAWPPNARQSSTMTDKTFGSGIDGRRQAGGTRADDGDVVEVVRDRAVETSPTQRASSISVGLRSTCPFGQTTMGNSVERDLELFDQHLAARIGLGIEPVMRMAIAPQEAFEPQHVAIAGAADDHRAAAARLDQPDATQDERTHDALAQLRLGDEESA